MPASYRTAGDGWCGTRGGAAGATTVYSESKVEQDAARWRWARADKTLWRGTYDYGVATPEEADAIADAEPRTEPHSKP